MNSPQFIGAFIKARHFNFSVFLCSQHFKRIPRICRLQASYLCFFALSNSECEVRFFCFDCRAHDFLQVLCEEFAPESHGPRNDLALVHNNGSTRNKSWNIYQGRGVQDFCFEKPMVFDRIFTSFVKAKEAVSQEIVHQLLDPTLKS